MGEFYRKKKLKGLLKLYGQEINPFIYAMAKMNAFIHDMDVDIRVGDTVRNPNFVKEAKYCENKPKFIIDKALLIDALKSLNLEYGHQFLCRSKIESVFPLKQRIKIFFCPISCLNPVRKEFVL